MTTRAPVIPQGLRICDPRTGQLTPEFLAFLNDVLRRLADYETRIAALETP